MTFRNPARRNRNIGTKACGHGRDNTLTIPDVRATDRIWYENLSAVEVVTRTVHSVDRQFFIEPVHAGFIHPCSVDEVCSVFAQFPAQDCVGLNAILFRQPTRKQNLLKPVWGRLTYFASLGLARGGELYEGALVTLEAQRVEFTSRWSKSLGPEDQLELDDLREEGHLIEDRAKFLQISTTRDSSRKTQLFRTLPHEVGHWVDYLQKVERLSERGEGGWSSLLDRYFQRPSLEREQFARRYAQEFKLQLR